jgi:glycerol-3-phosphate dehydrogenase
LRDEEFDLAVIGGGINGAAIARDAAARGLRVALVERGDFAGATSSSSSKLIHGGFRYLPQGQLALVYHALRERERLRHRTAPHLVHPIRFLFPIYRGRGFGRFTMSMGLWMYDLLARAPVAEWHRNLSAARVREMEPALAREELTGGALYFDGWGDDARITFENVLDAAIHRAAVANYVALEGFERVGANLRSARLHDCIAGSTLELRARLFVNAAGPWVDHVRRMDDPAAPPCVRLTKGVHLVFSRTRLPVRGALVLGDGAGRIVFVMPHDRYVLVGTTDTEYSGDPAAVRTDRSDVEYLLGVVAQSLPGIRLGPEDLASSFAGLRALVSDGSGSEAPSAVPREEVILESSSGLLTVAGGKLTTHREIAEKLGARVVQQLQKGNSRCPTRDLPLPGARDCAGAGDRAGAEALAALPRAAREVLIARHGTRASVPALIAAENSGLAEPVAPGCSVIGAEVIHAARNEMAMTLGDFMIRRTGLVWRYPDEAEAAAPAVARLLAGELNWDGEREAREVADFRRDLQSRRLPR